MTGFDCYPLVYGGHRSVLSPEPTNAKMRRPDGPVIPQSGLAGQTGRSCKKLRPFCVAVDGRSTHPAPAG